MLVYSVPPWFGYLFCPLCSLSLLTWSEKLVWKTGTSRGRNLRPWQGDFSSYQHRVTWLSCLQSLKSHLLKSCRECQSEHKKEICSYYCRELISNGKKAMFWISVQEGRTGKDMGYRKRNSERQGTWCLRKGAAFHGPAEGNQSCWVKEHIKQRRADGRVGTEYSCGPVHFPSFQSMNEVLSKI